MIEELSGPPTESEAKPLVASARASFHARFHVITGFGFLILAVLAAAAPLLPNPEDAKLVWRATMAVAGLLLLAAVVSLVLLLTMGKHAAPPPLERPEENVDFDAAWKAS